MFSLPTLPISVEPPAGATATPRKLPPQTPVRFPKCTPRSDKKSHSHPASSKPLVTLLQAIHRPADISLSHFEALGLHVISDSKPQDIIPENGYLPPVEAWNAIDADNLPEANDGTKNLLNNGNLSPGVQTYRERQSELQIDNTAAFRSIRRIPSPSGESAVRLGNAYEFFKNLEFFSSYWDDTSLPPKEETTDETSSEPQPSSDDKTDEAPTLTKPSHLQTHQRAGNGSQLPPEYRQNLMTAFVKLVAYDFGCNVSFPRSEPRLHLFPPNTSPPSYFNSSASFIFRTPTDRMSARSGIIEGPVAAISCRTSTVFATEAESRLDLAREVVAALLTAQHRAREGATEKRFGQGEWWTGKPRWGGGPGGPIGREADKADEAAAAASAAPTNSESPTSPTPKEKAVAETTSTRDVRSIADETRRIFGLNGPSPNKRSKKLKDGNMQIYENYRKMTPPSATWDRRTRYMKIGKEVPGYGYDDIFLISALNHHVCIIRVRVPEKLLRVLDGQAGEWDRVEMWRSKWYDLFLADQRIEAFQIVWGMIAYQMRSGFEKAPPPPERKVDSTLEKMDTTA